MAFNSLIMLVKRATRAGLVPAAQESRAYPELCKPGRVRQGLPAFDCEIIGMWCSKTLSISSIKSEKYLLYH